MTTPQPEAEPEIRVCAVCHRVLDHAEGKGWMHTMQDRHPEDHPAVPVPEGQVPIKGRCDFCNTDEPTWRVPVATFPMPGPGGERHYSQGDWAACDLCGELVARNRWDALLSRAWEHADRDGFVYAGSRDVLLKAALASLYSRVRRNRVGPLRRIAR